jgi:hypothetical protein
MAGSLAVVLVLVVAGGWLGLRVAGAHSELVVAADLLRQLQRAVAAGDLPLAERTLADLRLRTAAAAVEVEDPVWRVAASLPGPGHDMAAVRTVALALDDLVTGAIAPLLDAAAGIGPGALTPRDGGIDVNRIRASAPSVVAANDASRRVAQRIASVRTRGLSSRVRAPLTELRRNVERVVVVTDLARRVSAALPAMLGADGPRTYLVLFQNLAEVRATGGMPGAFAVISASGGRLTLVDQGTASVGLRGFDAPVLPIDAQTRALYSEQVTSHPASINMSPYFPSAAMTAREMYRLRSGRVVDGVLATDPVALSYLLRATGPVTVPNGPTLTADNAVGTLLSDVYARYRVRDDQDEYFAAAARATFDTLIRRPGDGRDLLAQLAHAAGERRILVWSARPEEQEMISGTVLEGALPTDDGDRPTIGVFLNEAGASKLAYYLAPAAELGESCRPDGRREVALRVTLASTAPPTGLPDGVLSASVVPEPSTLRLMVSVFAPTGWGVADTLLDGAAVPLTGGYERGRFVAIVVVDVPASGSRVVDVRLVDAARRDGAPKRSVPRLVTTPTVAVWRTMPLSAPRCPGQR